MLLFADGGQPLVCLSSWSSYQITDPPSPATKRQGTEVGPAFDGTFGVDSEDIGSIPHVDIATFQLFPDQVTYEVDLNSAIPAINKTVNDGNNWILQQISSGQRCVYILLSTTAAELIRFLALESLYC